MYDMKTRQDVLDLLEKWEYHYGIVSKKTGIPTSTIKKWVVVALRPNKKPKPITRAVEYYFAGNSNASQVAKLFNIASSSLLYAIHRDPRYSPKKKQRKHTIPEQMKILKEWYSGKNIYELAAKYEITDATIRLWAKKHQGDLYMRKKKLASGYADASKKELIAIAEKLLAKNKKLEQENAALESKKAILEKDVEYLEMEHAVLEKANESLKKDVGINYSNLTNREKAQIINALKGIFPIKSLLNIISLKRSTYFYEVKALNTDKYKEIRPLLRTYFKENYSCFGSRRLHELFKQDGLVISEKVIRRLMKEEHLIVYVHKRKRYSSYKGEITPAMPNIVNRNFFATEPNTKLLTDITEFSLCDGKVYLSPLIDCYTGTPITYTIGTSPSAQLTNTMLDNAHNIIGNNKAIIHSDRGFHYRLPGWIERMNRYGYARSMSNKGCSPDNSACEGFFGTLKNEFFYSKDWSKTTCTTFIRELSNYLDWFINKRIKKRLQYASPRDFMLKYNKI